MEVYVVMYYSFRYDRPIGGVFENEELAQEYIETQTKYKHSKGKYIVKKFNVIMVDERK